MEQLHQQSNNEDIAHAGIGQRFFNPAASGQNGSNQVENYPKPVETVVTNGCALTADLFVPTSSRRMRTRSNITANGKLLPPENRIQASSIDASFQCGVCLSGFANMDLLASHMEIHSSTNIFQCNFCDDSFSSFKGLSEHIDHHSNLVKPFKCGICNTGFFENSLLLDHLKSCHKEIPFLYKCNICLLLFKKASKLTAHVTKKHPISKEFKCGICQKRFTQGTRLTNHIQKHAQEESLKSPVCSIVSSTPTCLFPQVKISAHNHMATNEIDKGLGKNFERKTRSRRKTQLANDVKTETVVAEENSLVKISDDRKVDVAVDESYADCVEDEPLEKSVNSTKRKKHVKKRDLPVKKKPANSAIKNNEELIKTYRKLDSNTNSEFYDCDVCGLRLQDCGAFVQHRNDHFFDDKYCVDCQHCDQVFESFEDLYKHVGKEKCQGYLCRICGKSFALEPLLLTHYAKDHMDKKTMSDTLVCNICEKEFDSRTAYLRHASSHSEVKCIQCKLCRHAFTTPETLFGHLRTTHSLLPLTRKKYKFQCPSCHTNFMRMEAVKNHEKLVHNIEPDLSVIEQSEPEFKKPKPKRKVVDQPVRRTGHWRSVEDDKKRRTCPICNRIFRRFKDVRRHIGTHTKPHLCSHCGKSFPYRYSLDAHIKAFHSVENPFRCDKCNKYFSCPRSLIVHQRIHTGEKPHECHICDKKFRQLANLSMHLKLHNADKPIKCSLCDYRCRHRGYLKRHMSTHSKEKKHFCPICNKGFSEKPNLNHHLKRHSKTKNHVCSVCGHRFAERYYLNNHMRIHTKEKPYVCPVCNRAFTMRPNMVSHIKKTHPSYNYQPIRPSYHNSTISVIKSDDVDETSNSSISQPIIPSSDIMSNIPVPICSAVVVPPYPLLSHHTTNTEVSVPANISYIPHEQVMVKPSEPHFPTRGDLIQQHILTNHQQQQQQQHQQQIAIVRETQITRETLLVNQQVVREAETNQVVHSDSDGQQYVSIPNRLEENGFVEPHRDVTNQNFSMVMPGQEYLYSSYAALNQNQDPFTQAQGYLHLGNQHNQQTKP